jgi:hypothetical protein
LRKTEEEPSLGATGILIRWKKKEKECSKENHDGLMGISALAKSGVFDFMMLIQDLSAAHVIGQRKTAGVASARLTSWTFSRLLKISFPENIKRFSIPSAISSIINNLITWSR